MSATAQNMLALERANHIRLTRAVMRREIKTGQRTVHEVLSQVPPELESMAVGELLRAQTRWGDRRTRRLLSSLTIPEVRKLRDLTVRQRRALIAALGHQSHSSSPTEKRSTERTR